MASLQARKQALTDYIIHNMDEYDYNRGDPGTLGFRSYNDFVNHQIRIIENLNEAEIGNMEFLREKVIPKAKLMDMEDMISWEADGFVFDRKGSIVFFHER